MQLAETPTVVVAAPTSEISTDNDSSDEQSDYIHAYRKGISGFHAKDAVKKYKSHRKCQSKKILH